MYIAITKYTVQESKRRRQRQWDTESLDTSTVYRWPRLQIIAEGGRRIGCTVTPANDYPTSRFANFTQY